MISLTGINNNYIYNSASLKIPFGTGKLTKKELDILIDYKGTSESTNDYLRKINKGYSYHSPEKVQEIIKYMDSAMAKSFLDEDMVVYRFCVDPRIQPGMTKYKDAGFMNTCKRLSKVHDMIHRWGYQYKILKIHVPKGVNGIDVEKTLNRADEEAEVILPRNSMFDVVGFYSTKESFPDMPDKYKWALWDDDNRVVEMVMKK